MVLSFSSEYHDLQTSGATSFGSVNPSALVSVDVCSSESMIMAAFQKEIKLSTNDYPTSSR